MLHFAGGLTVALNKMQLHVLLRTEHLSNQKRALGLKLWTILPQYVASGL